MGGGARGHSFVQMKATATSQSPVARGQGGGWKIAFALHHGPWPGLAGSVSEAIGASRGVMGPRAEAKLPGTSQLDTGRMDVVICTGGTQS